MKIALLALVLVLFATSCTPAKTVLFKTKHYQAGVFVEPRATPGSVETDLFNLPQNDTEGDFYNDSVGFVKVMIPVAKGQSWKRRDRR